MKIAFKFCHCVLFKMLLTLIWDNYHYYNRKNDIRVFKKDKYTYEGKTTREIMTSSYSWSESPHSPKQQLDVTPNSLIVTLLQNQ